MKQLLTFSLMLICIICQAQSAWQRTHAHSDFNSSRSTRSTFTAASPNNAWMGSGVVYEFGESEISDNILVSGRVLLELAQVAGIHLPVMSNVELSFDQPINEFNIGLYPWKSITNSLVAHGGAQFDTDGQLMDNQFRLFAGAEFALFNDNGLPLTVSVTPVYLFGDNNQFGVDGVIVVPLANGLGVLGQVEGRFGDMPTRFSLGIVTNKIL